MPTNLILVNSDLCYIFSITNQVESEPPFVAATETISLVHLADIGYTDIFSSQLIYIEYN